MGSGSGSNSSAEWHTLDVSDEWLAGELDNPWNHATVPCLSSGGASRQRDGPRLSRYPTQQSFSQNVVPAVEDATSISVGAPSAHLYSSENNYPCAPYPAFHGSELVPKHKSETSEATKSSNSLDSAGICGLNPNVAFARFCERNLSELTITSQRSSLTQPQSAFPNTAKVLHCAEQACVPPASSMPVLMPPISSFSSLPSTRSGPDAFGRTTEHLVDPAVIREFFAPSLATWKGKDCGTVMRLDSVLGSMRDGEGALLRKSQSALELTSLNESQTQAANIDNLLQLMEMFSDQQKPPEMSCHKLTPEERQQKIARYRRKRDARNFKHTIKYRCRKTLADSRPRVRGRFARNDDPDSVMPHETKKALRERAFAAANLQQPKLEPIVKGTGPGAHAQPAADAAAGAVWDQPLPCLPRNAGAAVFPQHQYVDTREVRVDQRCKALPRAPPPPPPPRVYVPMAAPRLDIRDLQPGNGFVPALHRHVAAMEPHRPTPMHLLLADAGMAAAYPARARIN